MNSRSKKMYTLTLLLYGGMMVWLLFGRQRMLALPYWQHMKGHLNLIPFHTIRLFARQLINPVHPKMYSSAVVNLFGNVVLFIPLGFLLPVRWQWMQRFYRTLLWVILLIAGVEILQLLLRVGTCDIDDLILNTSGAALGYGIFRLLNRNRKE